MNHDLDEYELASRLQIELDPETSPYKMSVLNAFRKIEDPFGIEIMG